MKETLGNLLEKVFDGFKRITPALIAVSLLTGMVLFLPKSVLERMELDELPILWSRIIGIIFLLSVALIITILVSEAVSVVIRRWKSKQFRDNLKKKYKALSQRQKNIVQQLLKSKNKSVQLDKNSGDTIYLLQNGFIHQPAQLVTYGWNDEMVLTYVPQPWLMDLYSEEPELFQ